MGKIQIVGAFIAVLAFSMMAVASVSATLWLQGGKSLTSEITANSHSELTVRHTGLLGNFTMTCTLLLVGTVGAGASDKTTNVEGLKKELKTIECEFFEGGRCGTTNAKVNITEVNLPRHTLLELTGSSTVDHFLAESGKVPGYEIHCSSLTLYCEGLELELFKGNGTNGAIFEFNNLEKADCTDGGENTTTGSLEFLGVTVS